MSFSRYRRLAPNLIHFGGRPSNRRFLRVATEMDNLAATVLSFNKLVIVNSLSLPGWDLPLGFADTEGALERSPSVLAPATWRYPSEIETDYSYTLFAQLCIAARVFSARQERVKMPNELAALRKTLRWRIR